MKKWIFIVFAVAIVAFILFFYISFNGNFLSKAYAKHLLQNYISQVYEGETSSIDNGYFNFKDARYSFTYTIYKGEDTWEYDASIRGPFLPKSDTISSYLKTNSIDGLQSNDYQRAGEAFLRERLTALGIATTKVEYFISLPRDFYTTEQQWQPNVDRIVAPDIFIEITDDDHTEARFNEEVKAIEQLFEETNMTYAIVYISVMRTYDNSIEQREGYADIFYETLFSTELRPN